MHKILSTIILTTLLILTSAATGLTSWQLTLDVSTPDPNSDTGTATNKLTIGTDPIATDGYDNQFDTIALLRGPIQAYFSHPEYLSGQQKLWRDFRTDSLPKEWNIEVQSNANSSVNISWEINTADNLKYTLIDQDSNQEITMIPSNSYSYSSIANTPKRLLLRVSEDTAGTSPVTGNGGGSKGGGCGLIKDVGGKGGSMNERGQIALNMIILIMPLLLPIQNFVRRWVTIK